jgi:hypothetical protein
LQAAIEVGLSERQRKMALRIASIPKAEFKEAIESDTPATITALADGRERQRKPPKPSN